jgi:hypothetical protein
MNSKMSVDNFKQEEERNPKLGVCTNFFKVKKEDCEDIKPELWRRCDDCEGEKKLCDSCSFVPSRSICKECGLIRNHLSVGKITLAEKHYICYWCGSSMKNTRKNRREHGQKCVSRYAPSKVCCCHKVCVSCLCRRSGKTHYYYNCGCTYCYRCNIGYDTITPYLFGYCIPCSKLGYQSFVRDQTDYYCKLINKDLP